MNQLLIKRIAQLKNSEIPTGYKKTELGVLPSDWTIVSLGELLVFQNGVNVAKEKYDSGVKMISVMDILGDSPIYYDCIRGQVDIDGDTLKKYEVTYGDLLFLRSSETVEDAGIANVYLDRRGATFSGFVIRGKKNAQYEPYYLNKSLQNQQTRKQIIRNAAGTQHFNIGQASLNRVLVPFAPSSEQAKIAEILMTWDKAIELHKQQIEKLKQFKSVCLKKMFPAKGQTVPEWRFKGFTDVWEQRKLGEMGTTFTGLSGKVKEDFGHGDARFVTYMNVFTNPVSDPTRVEAVEIDKSQNVVQYGDVFFTTSSETSEEVGMSSVWLENTENTYLNSFCFGYRPTEKIDPHYMAYMLRSEAVRERIIYLAQGISRYNISKNGVMQTEVPLPNLAEQKLLGEYFCDLDNLITLHQRKVETYQKQYRILQQYLLNGIVRV